MATENHTALFEDGAHGLLIPGTMAPAPCPFCGSLDASVSQSVQGDGDLPDAYVAGCCDCGAEGPAGETRQEAAALWNKRAA